MGSLVKEYRVFPTGDTFKQTETVNNIAEGTSVTVSDNGPFYEAPPVDSGFDYCIYSRLFWNAAGKISSSQSVTATIKGVTVVTCWYQHGCSPGGIGTSISTYAFDVANNSAMAGVTPISSVTPAALWTSPSTSVTVPTSGTAVIDAKDSITGKNFTQWLVFGAGTLAADKITIPANSGGFYIAFYAAPKHSFDFGDLLGGLVEEVPGLDIDWVVDPSPIDRFRLALVAAQFAQRAAGSPVAQGVATVRKELTRVKAEISRLESAEKELEKQVLTGAAGGFEH
jgi:hypothetical protein